jgi:hypothetical protein
MMCGCGGCGGVNIDGTCGEEVPPTPPVGGGVATYQLIGPSVMSNTVTYTPIAYFPWLNSLYSTYTGGLLIYNVHIPGPKTVSIRLQNTTANVTLAMSVGIAVSGIYSTPITNPTANAQIELQVLSPFGPTPDPSIFGVVMQFNT